VLTGRYCFRTRLESFVLSGYSTHLIEEGRMTVASLLQEQGYHTAFMGKWHLGWDWTFAGDRKDIDELNSNPAVDYSQPVKNGPKEKGFLYSYGHCGSLDMPPYVYVENGMPTAVPERETGRTPEETKNGWWRKGPTASDFDHQDVLPNYTRRAVRYVRQQSKTDQPFFLYLALPAPHTPVLPSDEFKGKSGIDSAYADFVMMTDDCIGQVVKAVETSGIADNTLIIVTSDNGCSPQADYAELLHQGHNPSYIFRGTKADLWDGGHHVPFIVRWPGHVKASSQSDQTICLTDLMATCAEVLGIQLPQTAGEDSVSFLPALSGKPIVSTRAGVIHHSVSGHFAYRQGKWKLLLAKGSGGWTSPTEKEAPAVSPVAQLYDMEKDPGETTNLYETQPEVAQRLLKQLTSDIQRGRSTAGPDRKNAVDDIVLWKSGK
jgi:arylsulfatase A